MIRIIGLFSFMVSVTPSIEADVARRECLGRSTFEVPESFSWATSNIKKYRIDKSNGHSFTENVGGDGDFVSYDYNGLIVRVSDVTVREQLDWSRNAIIADVDDYNGELRRKLAWEEQDLAKAIANGAAKEEIEEQNGSVEELRGKIAANRVYEHDLGVLDAHILGGEDTPYEFFLWRNSRVYYFHMSDPAHSSSERIKDLVARFQPRDLYEIPVGPGICFPYGFIRDDGLTGYSVKNSLRFDSTPNVILSIINASPDMQMRPTYGIYSTHYHPAFDRRLWRKSSIMQAFSIGQRQTTLEGWRVDPRPDSGKKDRAWFAIAHVGGLLRPLLAVHMQTFPKGTDDLQTLTPPPEEVIPKFLKITESIRDL
ncbi:hypothetical protein [Pseudomonas sp. NPDC089406]|uniref:hypothetical protein n=1 Tax=Pseudomonas sp. NPDC089406 TaxID=3364463 RepID=UPI00384E622F